jgi:hypothetical protein
MLIKTVKIKAENLPDDVFIFLPKENKFFFTDFVEYGDKYVVAHFEPDSNPENWVHKRFKNDADLIIVSDYEVNENNLYD